MPAGHASKWNSLNNIQLATRSHRNEELRDGYRKYYSTKFQGILLTLQKYRLRIFISGDCHPDDNQDSPVIYLLSLYVHLKM